METLGIILLLALLFVYTPTIIDHIFCYVLDRRYKKMCEKRKKESTDRKK